MLEKSDRARLEPPRSIHGQYWNTAGNPVEPCGCDGIDARKVQPTRFRNGICVNYCANPLQIVALR
jgi:hypothetical protein